MPEPAKEIVVVKDPRRFMTLIYVISLSCIAVLSTIAHLVLDNVVTSQSSTGVLINTSGQQRMLSQRITLFTSKYVLTRDPEIKEEAALLIEKMQQNHSSLLKEHYQALEQNAPSPLSDAIKNMYFALPLQLDQQVTRFTQSANDALTNPNNYQNDTATRFEAEYARMAKGDFLNALDTVVKQYEIESVQQVNELRLAQNVVLIVIIVTILIEALYVFRPMVQKISMFANRLQRDANYDHLSGLYNRRAFYFVAEKLFQADKRGERKLSLVMLDIDRFKQINDSYGHDVGDETIKHISDVITSTVRKSDIVARFGGEEFLVLLPATDAKGGLAVAEKLRKQIEASPLHSGNRILEITVSGGVSQCLPRDENIDVAISRADKNLYHAKENGRNQVIYL